MTLEVACGATDSYIPHLGVMLHSLLSRTPRRPLRVWLMRDRPLPAIDAERLDRVVTAGGGRLQVLQVPDAMLRGFPQPTHFTASIWHRILLPDLLSDVQRVLYLDVDMVIQDDVSPLWDADLQGHLFGAIVAPFYPSQPTRHALDLGLPSVTRYVSSGVLLLDLAQMRAERCVEQIRAYAGAHPENPCPEQDALNALYHTRCLRLEPRWNAQPILFDTDPRQLPFPAEQVRRAVAQPAIVHFSGMAKPWHYLSRHPLRHLYFEHLRQTPWPEQPLQGRNAMNRALKLLPARWQYLAFRGLDRYRDARAWLRQRLAPPGAGL